MIYLEGNILGPSTKHAQTTSVVKATGIYLLFVFLKVPKVLISSWLLLLSVAVGDIYVHGGELIVNNTCVHILEWRDSVI